jgi:co-chaperonin GroES (HSP10)
MQAPTDKLLVSVKSRFNELTAGGLYKETSLNPEWHATTNGVVISNPQKLSAELKSEGVAMDLLPGDEAYFSYKVITDSTYEDNGDQIFRKVVHNAVKMVFTNGRKEAIVVTHIEQEKKFAGLFISKEGDITDRWIGPMEEIKKWMQNFHFQDNTVLFPDNLMIIEGKEYWKVDYNLVFGYKREEKVHAATGYVWIEPIEQQKLAWDSNSLILTTDSTKKEVVKGKGKAVHIGNIPAGQPKLSIKQNDIVIFNPGFAEQYEINGKNWLILKTDRILAREN